MIPLNFERLPRKLDQKIVDVQWKYDEPPWGNIIFTILFEVNNRLFYITADKTNLVELFKETNIVGFFQDIDVDVSGCFLKESQPLLWKDFFRLYFNKRSAEKIVQSCINLNKYYTTVNFKSWRYSETPSQFWDDDDILNNEQTLSIKYFLDEKLFNYKIGVFNMMSELSLLNLVQSTWYHDFEAHAKGVYNNKGEWVSWQTYFDNEFNDFSAVVVLKKYLLRGRTS